MNLFGTATVWAKIALVLIVIAFALQIAGFATDYWQQTETIQENVVYDIGLWNAQNCSGGHDSACDKVSIPDSYINASFNVVRGFECTILILVSIAMVVAALYVATERFREMSIAVCVAVVSFLAVTFGVIAMIVWLAQVPSNHYLGYSFGLCVLAFVLMFLAGVLMIPDIRNYQQRRGREALKVKPEIRPTAVYRPSKYDEVRNHDYSYNRRFTPATPVTPQEKIRHYYNPNRDVYIRSPPPSYRTSGTPDYKSTSIRTDVQTPDVYLGRDGRKHRRY
ncbi:uncharacterized protein LOC123565335 [Mercenaria mercenaria]|uniref:uncharacterized protein LOC123565335 n=1 Tax=Mercenaria mercenaria TaxID=6596 RepID=UPI00234E5966|nr:uncharacterized protein LOC123565335 [Mercenaria mercenaria]